MQKWLDRGGLLAFTLITIGHAAAVNQTRLEHLGIAALDGQDTIPGYDP